MKMENDLYIFDMDGTILDSMPVWKNVDEIYLGSHNIIPPPDYKKVIAPLTLPECAEYFRSLGVDKENKCIISDIIALVKAEYENNIQLKPGMHKLLHKLFLKEKTICLLTTSDKSYAIPALKRLGIYKYFNAVYTSTGLGLDKRTPQIYKTVCSKYGIPPENTAVYEDTLFAVRSAKGAGCHVVAVYDEAASGDWDEIKNTADEIFI